MYPTEGPTPRRLLLTSACSFHNAHITSPSDSGDHAPPVSRSSTTAISFSGAYYSAPGRLLAEHLFLSVTQRGAPPQFWCGQPRTCTRLDSLLSPLLHAQSITS